MARRVAKNGVENLIGTLVSGVDLDRVLEEHGMTAPQMVHAILCKRGKGEMAARRRLAKIQRELLAHRFSAFAVQKVCAVLQEKEKPELWLKAAAAVLEVARGERKGVGKKGESVEGFLSMSPELVKLVLRAMEMVERGGG